MSNPEKQVENNNPKEYIVNWNLLDDAPRPIMGEKSSAEQPEQSQRATDPSKAIETDTENLRRQAAIEKNKKLRAQFIEKGIDPDNLPDSPEQKENARNNLIKKILSSMGHLFNPSEKNTKSDTGADKQPEEPSSTKEDVEEKASETSKPRSFNFGVLHQFEEKTWNLQDADKKKRENAPTKDKTEKAPAKNIKKPEASNNPEPAKETKETEDTEKSKKPEEPKEAAEKPKEAEKEDTNKEKIGHEVGDKLIQSCAEAFNGDRKLQMKLLEALDLIENSKDYKGKSEFRIWTLRDDISRKNRKDLEFHIGKIIELGNAAEVVAEN